MAVAWFDGRLALCLKSWPGERPTVVGFGKPALVIAATLFSQPVIPQKGSSVELESHPYKRIRNRPNFSASTQAVLVMLITFKRVTNDR